MNRPPLPPIQLATIIATQVTMAECHNVTQTLLATDQINEYWESRHTSMTANQPLCMQVDKWNHSLQLYSSIESFPPVLEDGNGNKLWMFLIILFLLRFAFVGNWHTNLPTSRCLRILFWSKVGSEWHDLSSSTDHKL